MHPSNRNRSIQTMAAAERAHCRATGDGDLGDVAAYILVRACNITMSERLSRLFEPHDLTAMGYITMMSLYSQAENLANPSELSEITGETRGNMTRICDELVEKGWMRRVPNAADRRRVDLSLSAAGMELLDTLAPRMRQQASEFHDRAFTKAEKSSLLQLLTKLSVALASQT